MNTATNRTLKCAISAIVFGCMAAFSWSAVAHPLGQGNCLPRYHEWRNATFDLRDARTDLATYNENLKAAVTANNVTATAFWTLVVGIVQAQITNYHEPRVARLLTRFQDCDHY